MRTKIYLETALWISHGIWDMFMQFNYTRREKYDFICLTFRITLYVIITN